jgi:HlyD family secretion protein
MINKIKRSLTVLFALLLLVTLSGCSGNSDQIKIKTAESTTGQINASYSITGALVPAQTAVIAAPFSARVTAVSVAEGDRVTAGQVLARLDDSQLRAQLAQASANYQVTQSSRTQAKISLDNAASTLARIQSLYNEGAVAKSDLDNAQKAYDLARNQYSSSSSASSDSALASVDSIKVQIANAQIKSPFTGVVLSRNINAGENVTMGTGLLSIADMSSLKLKGTVPQEALPYIKVNDPVDLSIDIYPDRTFKGFIHDIGAMSVSTGTYFPIEVSIANSENLSSGLSAHAALVIKGTEHILVPTSAVVENNGESYLFVIRDGIAYKTTVITGLRNDDKIEILKGLASGKKVAVTNANHLFDKMPVQIIED